eukprot:CAMPEP_0196810816 /NCGR_PEP_ID=MMETSP1362-20130617/14340_1 /TAXON_ID=163516 /ORGANISM="Leptocylindrus danicus, Strain CCMP1856" /LENGTH=1177 /DNA_ID=CAMNT_0042185969 /DNA_START=93 /DNA_END=3626 /DNA_ORIENTATION=+
MATLPPNLNFAEAEEEICNNWKENNTFHTQSRLAEERGDKEYTFYDGPPFATGLPHYGHILAGTIKDTVTRYACLTGHRVSRRAGWDCHGLPVEYEIDQMLGIKHRDDVLAMGIDKYNAECRKIVTRYTKEWESTVTRLGRWIDFENDYKTMDVTFMESVWWVFGQLWEKNLVYLGCKVMPYSTKCATPLSNFEAGLNYKDVTDPAVVVSFPVTTTGQFEGTSLLAWTTTPWTLPSNLALCVNEGMEYVLIEDLTSDKEMKPKYIILKARMVQLFPQMASKKFKGPAEGKLYKTISTMNGKDLVGLSYKPIFDFFKEHVGAANFWTVVADNYVSSEGGTGIVHQAPAFGEDDYRVCMSNSIIDKDMDIPCPVDPSGLFTKEVPICEGVHVKEADPQLIAALKGSGRLVQKSSIVHSYPYCWRSDTPLIYRTIPSWFINVESIRDRILENNETTRWVPDAVKTGRMRGWLQDARDWAVSRNRFWGTPIPIWHNEETNEYICISSREQLAELAGVSVDSICDLHREFMDKITIPSQKHPGTVLTRVDEVFDCWFESGSMPYAQRHYPFEGKEDFDDQFPADFIAEGLDQTRGWFYTLQVLATALFDKPAFKNLIVNGLVLAADGKKMSKRLKNYPDPKLVIGKYGADALRMYLINSPVVRAESLKFQESGVLGVVKEVFLPWYNAFRFFLQNVNRNDNNSFVPDLKKVTASANPTDIWIQALTQDLIKYVHEEMEAYRLYTVMPALVSYINQLTNWYVRLNRDRLKGTDSDATPEDTDLALQVLYNVLLDVTLMMAPFTPFLTDFFYQHLRKLQPSYADRVDGGGTSNPVMPGKSDSVHFLRLPVYDPSRLNDAAVQGMSALQSIVELARVCREKRNISLRTPIKSLTVILRNPSPELLEQLNGPLRGYILSEMNAWDLKIVSKEEEKDWVKLSLLPNLKVLGKKLGKKMGAVKKHIVSMTHEDAVKAMEAGEIVIGDVTLDCNADILSKLSFCREGDMWESGQTDAGDAVVAIDCTQDKAILDAGKAREFISYVQQLRKGAGLIITDAIEVFYHEEDGVNSTESAIAGNVDLILGKLKVTPLPKRFMAPWSVVFDKGEFEVGGSKVEIIISRPAVVVKDGLSDQLANLLSILDISAVGVNEAVNVVIDGEKISVTEGVDFWTSAAGMVKTTGALEWIS